MCTPIAVLLVSVREQPTLIGEGTFHVPFHVGHCLEQLQIAIMKETYVETYFFSSMTAIEVGEADDPLEEVVGEISNPISFNNSLGAKSEVVCSGCKGCCGTCSFLSFLCFLCFFLSLPPPFGILSTIFCRECMGE